MSIGNGTILSLMRRAGEPDGAPGGLTVGIVRGTWGLRVMELRALCACGGSRHVHRFEKNGQWAKNKLLICIDLTCPFMDLAHTYRTYRTRPRLFPNRREQDFSRFNKETTRERQSLRPPTRKP